MKYARDSEDEQSEKGGTVWSSVICAAGEARQVLNAEWMNGQRGKGGEDATISNCGGWRWDAWPALVLG